MELRICREHGIPHSKFMGWSQLDRDKAIALVLIEAEECPRCHTVREDWLDGEGRWLKEPVYVPVIRSCPGCGETHRVEESMTAKQRKDGGFVALQPLIEHLAEVRP